MGVIANEYVRRLSAEQFAERSRDDVRTPQRDKTGERRHLARRWLIRRGFRRLAEAMLT
jgi:hypothetical protein